MKRVLISLVILILTSIIYETCISGHNFPVPRKKPIEEVKNRRDILIFNRVAKAGSTLIKDLAKSSARSNHFNFKSEPLMLQRSRFLSPEEQESLRRRVLTEYPLPLLLTRHVNFIPFEDDGYHPLYINIMREPLDRFRSRFKYARTFKIEEQYHFRLNLPQYEPLAVANQSFDEWREKTLEACILNDDDRECNMKTGDTVENQMAYFCGQDYECSLHGSKAALMKAKYNVEKYYAVAAVLERLEESLKVMEKRIPEFFRGVSKLYTGQRSNALKDIGNEEESNQFFDVLKLEPRLIVKMKNTLAVEYEFYDFLNKRLSQQIQDINKE